MKILPIYFNSKNAKFCSNQRDSNENWKSYWKELVKNDDFFIIDDDILKTNNLSTLNKPKFEYSDYELLPPRVRWIIRKLYRINANHECYYTWRKNLSIEKDAERILELASKAKEFLDCKYKNGYKLVGIGRSPETIVETMQLLGADTAVIPFSKDQIEIGNSREFPYEHLIPDENAIRVLFSTYYGPLEKCSAKDWEEYLQYYGIDKNFSKRTGKALIFTDYIYKGNTKKYFESILKGLGFGNNYEFIDIEDLFLHDIGLQLDYNLTNWFHGQHIKDYAKMSSPSFYYREVDILKHPEYISSLPESLRSKLFRCALYYLIKKNW